MAHSDSGRLYEILDINLDNLDKGIEQLTNVYYPADPTSLDNPDVQRLAEGYKKIFTKSELVYFLFCEKLFQKQPDNYGGDDVPC